MATSLLISASPTTDCFFTSSTKAVYTSSGIQAMLPAFKPSSKAIRLLSANKSNFSISPSTSLAAAVVI